MCFIDDHCDVEAFGDVTQVRQICQRAVHAEDCVCHDEDRIVVTATALDRFGKPIKFRSIIHKELSRAGAATVDQAGVIFAITEYGICASSQL